jgi:TonB family protein
MGAAVIVRQPMVLKAPKRWGQAVFWALCAEGLALMALAQWLEPKATIREISPEMALVSDQPEPPPPAPAPPKPQPVVQPKQAVQAPLPAPPQVATTERTEVAAEPPLKPMPQPLREATIPVLAAPVAPAKTPDHSEFMAKVRSAVQQAFEYPAAASALGLHGRVKVKFRLNQKTPSNAQVLISSGVSMIDRAAIASVMKAHYPDPTTEVNLSQLEFEIWIEYRPS